MLTNEINVTYNMKNIDDDFDVFRVEKNNKDYYKCNILDSAVYEFKAAAVQWSFGAVALVLFRKGEVTEKNFEDSIMAEFEDVKVQKVDLFDSQACEKNFYYKNRLLAQLLMNSMPMPKHEEFMYNNLTGKLFYHDPSWKQKNKLTNEINFIRFLEININPGMYLNLDHKTFKKCDSAAPGLYVIDVNTGEFRKKLKKDVNVITYKEGSLPHNHFRVDNFNITDYVQFRKCKLGIMAQFLRDVKENLSKYITIEMKELEDVREFDISRLEKKGISELEYGEMLQKKGVVIVDENDTEDSKNIVKTLKSELKNYYGIKATVGKLSKKAYNIRIIHEEEYYAENEMNDLHNDNLKGYIVQHITEEAEEFKNPKSLSPAIKKVVQELIIKGDVREKMLSIFDWERFDSKKNWTFVIRKRIKNNLEDAAKHIKHYNYYRLQIDCNGKLEFDSFCDINQIENDDWEKICCGYDFAEKKHWKIKNEVEGLIYSDIEKIHAVILTKWKTIPNITAISDVLKETDVRGKISKETLVKAMEEFENENKNYMECISEWKRKLPDENMITKGNVKKILDMKKNKKIASLFNRFLHEHYGIWIDGELRKNEFEKTFQIGSLLNIKYEYIKEDFEDGKAFVYYVGAKSKRRSYPNACCIRKIVVLDDEAELECEKLLSLMAVEFVRNGQYTVLPFPFKYLREFMAQC